MRPRGVSAGAAVLTPQRFAFLALGPHAAVGPTWPYDDALFEACLDDALLQQLWATHRVAVLAEASQRGLSRPLWVERMLDGSR